MSIEKKILLAAFCVGFGLNMAAQSPIPLKSLQTAVNKPGTEGDNARQVGVTDGNGKQRYVAYTDVLVSPIGYTPAATGNTINLSRFVQRNDSIWYIDFEGDSKLLKVPGGGAVNDADWLKIRNNGVPYSITDSIYTLKTVSINGRNYFPDVELNVYDSTSVFGATVASIGNRGGRFAGYNTVSGAWSSFGQEGSLAQIYGGAGTTSFVVSEVTGTSPGSPSGTFEQHFELDLVNNNAKFNKYPNSRNDTGKPVNLLTTNSSGGVESHSVSDLKDSLGLAIASTLIPYGTGTGLSSDANFNYTTATRKMRIGNIWLWNGLSLASSNVGLGVNSLNSTTSGTEDVMVGTSCGGAITGATQCTGVGGNAMFSLQTGFNNTAVGFGSMPSLANASNVTCLGANSAATKSNQVVIGDATITEVLFKTGSKFAHVTSTTLDASTNGYVWMYDNATSNIKLQPIATGIKKREQNFVATAAQTVFTLSSYTPTAPTGNEYPIEVFRNGVRLSWVASAPTVKQYTYTGAAVTMTACALNDDVVITYIK